MPLTDVQIKRLKLRANRCAVSDGRGLALEGMPTGVASWQRYGPGLDPAAADRLIAASLANSGSSEAEIAGVLRERSNQGLETGQPADQAYCKRVAAGAVSQIKQRASEQRGVER